MNWEKGPPIGTIVKRQSGKTYRNFIKIANGKEKNSRNYRAYAIWLIEKQIGRSLTSDEVVHHINKLSNDDRIENLQLMKRSEHISHHQKGQTCSIEKRIKSKIYFFNYRSSFLPQILELYNQGKSIRKITEIVGIHRNTITRTLEEWNNGTIKHEEIL